MSDLLTFSFTKMLASSSFIHSNIYSVIWCRSLLYLKLGPIRMSKEKMNTVDQVGILKNRHVKKTVLMKSPSKSIKIRSVFYKSIFYLSGYGLTETSPVAITQPPDWIKPGSTGVPIPNTEVKVSSLC